MKIFAILDDEIKDRALGHLVYYEKCKRFYVELPNNADEWETPLLLASFAKRGETTVNAYWSRLWVQQRIVPTDRQNLGQILKVNGLKEYDEFKLLMLARGRCAQDDCYLKPTEESDFNLLYAERLQQHIKDVVPLNNFKLLVFFRDGSIKICNAEDLISNNRLFKPVLTNTLLFERVAMEPGGYGICWGSQLCISYSALYKLGKAIPLSPEDFSSFLKNSIINTHEAAALLDCSRQNINNLMLQGKFTPVRNDAKNTLFRKSEIFQYMWK